MPEGGWVTATWARQCPADACCSLFEWHGSESNRQNHQGLSLAALPVCVPCHILKASPAGFEPAISTVTGWRALQAAPRGRMLL